MTRSPLASLFLLALLIASTTLITVTAAAWPHDPFVGNVAVATGPDQQLDPRMVTDGAGGFIVIWRDATLGQRLFAQRVSSIGSLLWSPTGVGLRTTATLQLLHNAIPDGAGGVIATWQDTTAGASNIHAQRLNASGTALWGADGVVVCGAAGTQTRPVLASDGAGGAIIAWHDYRGGASADIFAQRISAAGAAQWTPNGVPVCSASASQLNPAIASDGTGGVFIAWEDNRFIATAGFTGVFIQRVMGTSEMQWATNGIQVGFNTAYGAQVAADGVGGALVAWTKSDGPGAQLAIATRLSSSGANLWNFYNGGSPFAGGSLRGLLSDGAGGAYGLSSSTPGPSTQLGVHHLIANGQDIDFFNFAGTARDSVRMVPDPSGGVFVAWSEGAPSLMDVAAASFGSLSTWTSAATAAVLDQTNPALVADNNGGVLVAWEDFRDGQADIYCQRIGGHGCLGNPEPSIASVRDIPNDQGGKVRLAWNASYLDATSTIKDYWIWRQVPAALAEAALRHGARLYGTTSDRNADAPLYDRTLSTAGVIYWEYVTSQVASQDAGYSVVTATTSDSIAGSNPRTLFRVQAHAISGPNYWNSAPDSGYSVDNLVPVSPAPFAGQYGGGTTILTWNPNTEPDLAGYHVYRGTSPGFVIGPGSLIATLPDTGFVDSPGQPRVYKVTAVDVHGNESSPAVFVPGVLVDVGPGDSDAGLSLAASPNPASRVATLSFTLPGVSDVRLEIFDQQGRLVATLARGALSVGTHRPVWDLRDAAGRLVESGVYFARLETRFGQRSQRFAVIR